MRDEHGEPDVVEVRKTFGADVEACRLWEERVLARVHSMASEKWLNKKAGCSVWFHPAGVNKGRKFTDEHKAKISEANVGKVNVIDVTTGISSRVTKQEYLSRPDLMSTTLGRRHTQETRDKISESLTGRTVPAETREKISLALRGRLGRTKSAEERLAVSEKNKGFVTAVDITTGEKKRVTKEEFESNESLRGNSAGQSRLHTDASKAKISEKNKGFITAFDLSTNSYRKVTGEEFHSDPNLKGLRWKPK